MCGWSNGRVEDGADELLSDDADDVLLCDHDGDSVSK